MASTLLVLGAAEEHFLRRASNRVTPNGFTKVGCWDAGDFTGKLEYTGSRAMTHETCFSYCAGQHDKHGVGYFGIRNGKECWCAALYDGPEAPDKCTVPCAGGGEDCGGPVQSSVFIMYHCVKNAEDAAAVKAEQKADDTAAKEEVLRSYTVLPGQTCGQGHGADNVKVAGAETLVGSPDDCKLACGDEINCGGFTYEEDVGRCIFHGDVHAGERAPIDTSACFTKTGR